ncbi:Ribonuclease H-like domain,Chromo/chromo shadow domain,Integrase, catalytic core,Chromo domain-like [Cinara cedri]|uniref:Ribonuclease H-like domain,Chromo/chromo shadow domain,Integrase, catalytic core,Chromo domain-like n=1 Tax=Cinara cedri TaxID=506608 RepID=A0A5E4N069_9HEMI|nr:Ribonuclease H-like domain,Chromo/chromo shadow domain,Integrase, catalytic core,Chromo domain-like [Cinara cedri]
MISYSKKNKCYKYILCVIDCFTKYAWAIPLKSKTAKEVTHAMSTILINRSPQLLQLDNGKEFYNSTFDTLMKKYNVKKYSTFSTTKACIVERFNRTLKEKMFREFTARGNHNWLSILSSLINEYNNSKHRTIGMIPLEADNNPGKVKIKRGNIPTKINKFKVGDSVRVSTQKGVFTKGYLPNWSTEIFTIVKINKTTPTTYMLNDYTGGSIAGCFYSEELNKTDFPNDYLVEKVIRTKEQKIFVKWLGFDESHNSWINKNDVKE